MANYNWLNKQRKGKLMEFGSYVLYNKKVARDTITFVRIAQLVVFTLFAALFWMVNTVVAIIFTVMVIVSAKAVYDHFKYNRHKIALYSFNDMKGQLTQKPIYVESKIVRRVNDKWQQSRK